MTKETITLNQEEQRRGQGRIETRDATSPYAAMLRDRIRLGPRRLRVALDCGNGTASLVVPGVLAEWGVEVVPLYCESDPRFPTITPIRSTCTTSPT